MTVHYSHNLVKWIRVFMTQLMIHAFTAIYCRNIQQRLKIKLKELRLRTKALAAIEVECHIRNGFC